MRITWLLEAVDQLWGGVKVALDDANWLHRRGHRVTVLSRSGPPQWMQLECAFRSVPDFCAENLPDADVVIGTFWTTVPWAACAGAAKGVPVHLCQGYEGDFPEHAALRDRIESVYRLPRVQRLTVAPHLTRLLAERFGIHAETITHTIDHAVHRPGPERAPGATLRVGLVGPYQVGWKDLATGYAACELAHRAGQQLVLVRATNTVPDRAEQGTPFPVEWHRQVPPARMGDFYRSLDVMLCTSSGAEEGFFLPAVEAMACGVPTILTDVPCFRDHGLADGDHGHALFVPPKDPAAMAEALVLAGRMAEVRSSLRQNGIRLADRYHQDRHGEQLEAALARFASQRAGERSPLRMVDDGGASTSARHRLEQANESLEAGDPEAALRTYDELAAEGCDDAALHACRGHALHALGRLQDAVAAFRVALAVGARTADAHNRIGVVLFQIGDLPAARQHFEKALMLQPDHGDARANLQALPAA